MDRLSMNRPEHSPLPMEKCPVCYYETAYHHPLGWIRRGDGIHIVYKCGNETCFDHFEGEITFDTVPETQKIIKELRGDKDEATIR